MTKHNKTIDPPRRIWARACALALIAAMLLTGAYAGGAVTLAESKASTPGTIETVDTRSKGVHINLFDYDSSTVNPKYMDSQNSKQWFQFIGGGTNSNDFRWNHWTGAENYPMYSRGGVYQGILKKQLGEDQFPALVDQYGQDTLSGDASLKHLFSPNNNSAEQTITDANHLFSIDENGYYVYDSRQNFASINAKTRDFKVYRTAYQPNEIAASNPKFLPFNDLRVNASQQIDADHLNSNVNYHFGMTVDFNFLQPKDGKADSPSGEKQNMKFEFTGDDDVWLFIDGYLVLDMGGIHDPYEGTVNFATGDVFVERIWGAQGAQTGGTKSLYQLMEAAGASPAYLEKNFEKNEADKWIFKDYTTHTFNYYYLERGAGGSNCKIKFNLQSIPDDTLYVQKLIQDSPLADFADAEFRFQVDVSQVDQNGEPRLGEENLIPYQGYYQIYKGVVGKGNGTPVGEPQYTGDGTFILQHYQYVKLLPEHELSDGQTSTPVKATSDFRAAEIDAYSNHYQVDINNSTATWIGEGGQTGAYTSGLLNRTDASAVIFRNIVTKDTIEKMFTLKIEKKLRNGAASDDSYPMQIMIGGKPYANGLYYQYDKAGNIIPNEHHADANGTVRIPAGEAIAIQTVPWGTSFEIKEILGSELQPKYQLPTYQIANGADTSTNGSASGKIPENETQDGTTTTVTITNTLKTGGFTIKKVGEENAPLTGAGFELREAIANWDDTWSDQENGQVYYPNDISGFLTGVDGIAAFQNIPFGTYLLYETKAPAGYQLPTAPIRVTVSAKNVTLTINGEQVTVPAPTGEAETGREVPIPNKEKDQLPIAGGAGTLWFTYGGLALTGAAALLYGRQRRSKGKHE